MFDPISIWMQSSLFWIKLFKQQQDAYLAMLGNVAEKMPHESAQDLSREAEAMKDIATSGARKTARKPAAGTSTKRAELATA